MLGDKTASSSIIIIIIYVSGVRKFAYGDSKVTVCTLDAQ